MSEMMSVIIIIMILCAIAGMAEVLYIRKMPVYMTRKILHIGGSVVAAALPYFMEIGSVIVLGAIIFVALIITKRAGLLQGVHGVKDSSIGAFVFVPSVLLAAIIYWPISVLAYQGSVLVLGIADGMAGIIGSKYGRMQYYVMGKKSIEGSIVFFIITALVLCGVVFLESAMTGRDAVVIICSALILTFIEGVSGKGWDNLFVPLVAGSIIIYLV